VYRRWKISHAHGLVESNSENKYITNKILLIQCNAYQNSNDIHQREWKFNPKSPLDAWKTMNSQGNTKKKEQSQYPTWRYHNTGLQTIIQSHSNKNTMVLKQEKKWRIVEHYRRPRYESTQLGPLDFWQRYPKYIMEKRHPLQQILLGKLDICM
jgi:hypothetical protein